MDKNLRPKTIDHSADGSLLSLVGLTLDSPSCLPATAQRSSAQEIQQNLTNDMIIDRSSFLNGPAIHKTVGDADAAAARKIYQEAREKAAAHPLPGAPKVGTSHGVFPDLSVSTINLSSTNAEKLRTMSTTLLDNFATIDANGDRVLSSNELESALAGDRFDENTRNVLTSAAKNVDVLAELISESSNNGKYADSRYPSGTAVDRGISRLDLFCAQSALGLTAETNLYRQRRSNSMAVGGALGLSIGTPLAPFSAGAAFLLAERYLPRLPGGVAMAGGLAAWAIICGGTGALAGDMANNFSYGTEESYYSGKRNQLAWFRP